MRVKFKNNTNATIKKLYVKKNTFRGVTALNLLTFLLLVDAYTYKYAFNLLKSLF